MMPRITHCYHCGVESAENKFKYYNNGKRTQPRYECSNCKKLFTLGSQGYPPSRAYTKKRNVDPPELQGLSRTCRCCGAANNAQFKYYNNKSLSQPRFQCNSCGQQFQMRLIGGGSGGEERRLVHTKSYQRPPSSSSQLKRVLAPSWSHETGAQTTTTTTSEVDPWMPGVEEVGKGYPALSVEDARCFELLETGLRDESEAPAPETVLRLQKWASELQLLTLRLGRQ